MPAAPDSRRLRVLATLREARHCILFALACFLTGTLVGLAWPSRFQPLLGAVRQLAASLEESGAGAIILTIFLQNGFSAFLAVWLGAILGLVPLAGAVANGILLGVVLAATDRSGLALLSLIPHGIFELPAIFFAWGLGIWQGMWVFAAEKQKTFRDRAKKARLVFLALILPLLAIAAVIEGLGIALLR